MVIVERFPGGNHAVVSNEDKVPCSMTQNNASDMIPRIRCNDTVNVTANGKQPKHGLQSLPPSPKRAERKGRRRPFREAGSGHKQWNTVSCVDTFSIINKFSAQNSKI